MKRKEILKQYQKEKNIAKTARAAGISPAKLKKILISEGLYECKLSREIAEMRLQGISKALICKRLGISTNLYSANTPYEKAEYNSTTPSYNALKIRKSRKNKEETRMISLEKVQENLEKLIGKTYHHSESAYDDIICAWEDFEHNGETQVIVSDDGEQYDPPFLSTYINEKDSPEFTLYIERDVHFSEEYGENVEEFTITEIERDSRW